MIINSILAGLLNFYFAFKFSSKIKTFLWGIGIAFVSWFIGLFTNLFFVWSQIPDLNAGDSVLRSLQRLPLHLIISGLFTWQFYKKISKNKGDIKPLKTRYLILIYISVVAATAIGMRLIYN